MSAPMIDRLFKTLGVEERKPMIDKLDPGDFIVTRAGFLGRFSDPTVSIGGGRTYEVSFKKDTFGLAVTQGPSHDIVYVFPRTEWKSLYNCATVAEATVHMNKLADNPDLHTAMGSKFSFAMAAKHYRRDVEPWLDTTKVKTAPVPPSALPYQTFEDGWNAMLSRTFGRQKKADEALSKGREEQEPAPLGSTNQPVEHLVPLHPAYADKPREPAGGFVRAITTYAISGTMEYGENRVKVDGTSAAVRVVSSGGAMNSLELDRMIQNLIEVRNAMDDG